VTPQEIVALARVHPLYAGRALNAERFEDIAILDKQQLDAALQTFYADPANLRGLYLSPSGGSSTRSHLCFPVGIEDNKLQRRWFASMLGEAGIITPDTIALNLFAGRLMYRSLEIFTDYCEQLGATSLPVESMAADTTAVDVARQFHANMIIGEPGRLVQLAQHLRDTGQRLPVQSVLAAGEAVRPAQRRLFAEVFATDVLLSAYGSAETGVWAYRGADDDPDVFHYDPRMLHVEILETDADGVGVMVVTNLLRRHVPVLRYRMGDRARWIARGETRSTFQFVGREASSFTLDGSYFNLPAVSPVLAEMTDYQLHLSSDADSFRDRLEVRVVPPDAWDTTHQHALESRLSDILGASSGHFLLHVRPVKSEELERSPTSRKVRRIVDTR
jgi:phenylacetate-coenzyme A ligase PaaK-like adenylate-forming protein